MESRIGRTICVIILFTAYLNTHAVIVIGPWQPLFKSVDQAFGQAIKDTTNPLAQVVHVLRVDLTDPDVELFTTPACAYCPGNETIGRTTSDFVEAYRLQGAVNTGFFPAGASPSQPMTVHGLLISRGVMVSSNWIPAEGGDGPYSSILRFTTNKVGSILPLDNPPASEAGIYTAVAGNYPLLTNGVIVANDYSPEPRTALGLSQDRRFLFMLTIDGRQPGYSEGAPDVDTANWLLRFGAYNAINVDGGGSTTMAIEPCPGKALVVNSPIEDGVPGLERVVSANFGFYAKPLPGFINDLHVEPGAATAIIRWTTLSNSTTQVEYGTMGSYGSTSTLDSTLTTNHSVELSGLTSGTNYFFRGISRVDTNEFSVASCFVTPWSGFWAFGISNVWNFNTNNLSAVNWNAPNYNDTNWSSGPGLLWVDLRATPYGAVQPKATQMPPAYNGTNRPFPTYYFRTHFNVPGSPAGASLIFSNFLDDGAVFYLNGTEIHRAFMPATPIGYTTLAASYNCAGDADCPYIFTVDGSVMTNLLSGNNVLAVEMHNYAAGSPDISFGSALFVSLPPPTPVGLHITRTNGIVTLTWDGIAVVQQSTNLGNPSAWSSVPGPVQLSPYVVTNTTTAKFFRLRN